MSDAILKQALDPRAFVEARSLPGGAAPKATSLVLDQQSLRIKEDAQWLEAARGKISGARALLKSEINDILATSAE